MCRIFTATPTSGNDVTRSFTIHDFEMFELDDLQA